MTTLSIAPREEQIELQGVSGTLDPAQFVAIPEEGDRKVEFVFAPGRGGACSLTLFNHRYVEYRRSGRRGRCAVFNLAFVDPQPVHDVNRAAVQWCLCILGVIAVVAGAAYGMWPAAVAGAGLAVVFAVIARGQQHNRWTYYSRHGRIALFELNQTRSDEDRLQKLIGILARRSQLAWGSLPPGKERLAVEVAEHRRLMDSAIISQARYERAKRRIFGRYKG